MYTGAVNALVNMASPYGVNVEFLGMARKSDNAPFAQGPTWPGQESARNPPYLGQNELSGGYLGGVGCAGGCWEQASCWQAARTLPLALIAVPRKRPCSARDRYYTQSILRTSFNSMSLSSFDTIWPADSVEFCPHTNATNIFVCGTYNLEKPDHAGKPEEDATQVDGRAKQTRRGKCLLFAIENEADL